MSTQYKFSYFAYRSGALSWYVYCTVTGLESGVWFFAFADGNVTLVERRKLPDAVDRYPVSFAELPPVCRARIRGISQRMLHGRLVQQPAAE